MPNWCENTLTVTGPELELAAFKHKVHDYENPRKVAEGESKQVLSFAATVPEPIYKEEDGADAWYHWRHAHWGTKWNASDPRLEETDGSLIYHFDTAWGPPTEWLEATIEKFPKLQFRLFYAEGGMGFAGVIYGEDGQSHKEEKGEYVAAMIEEYGSFSACCEHCDDEVVLEDADERRVCADCMQHVCVHCNKLDTEHIDGKCLYDSGMFKSLSDAEATS